MMVKQRTTEWFGNIDFEYHERQFKEPYRSTVAFCDWLEAEGFVDRNSEFRILDLCCGLGANIFYMSKRYPRASFIGVDINPDIVEKGNLLLRIQKASNCCLELGDLYSLGDRYLSRFHGIVSLQSLSWLPDFQEPLESMIRLKAQWIALTSLFYEGRISCTIQVKEYDEELSPHRESFYNVLSLPLLEKALRAAGYRQCSYAPFTIDKDLPKPASLDRMGTYTKRSEDGTRFQISGPLLMPWYFLGAKR